MYIQFKKLKVLLAVLALFSLSIQTAYPAQSKIDSEPSSANDKTKQQVLSFIEEVVDQQPRYRSWPIFPSNADSDSNTDSQQARQYASEYFLKRLGLPVHGRWISTYVNPVAYDYLVKAIKQPPADGKLALPQGSIIVKENFLTREDFKAGNNTDTSILPGGGPLPRPAVLTILYKNSENHCQTGYKFNGKDCFGGEWLWIYSGVNPKSKQFDAQIIPQNFCINCHAPAFNSDYLRSLQSQRRVATIEQKALTPLPGKPAPAVDVCEGLLTLSPDLPADVPLDPAKVSNAQKMFDCFSWKSFVALNWPANSKDRGQPDTKVTRVKDSGFLQGPRVWQTYKETYEVFQPTNSAWNPSDQKWNNPQPRPEGEGCAVDLPVVSMISKSQSMSATEDVGNETGQAFAGSFGTLTDQNNNLVRYEVRFNRDEFDYILNTKSAVTKNLVPSGPKNPNLPDNKTGKFGGAIEIKAAWREMCTPEWEQQTGRQCFPAIDNQDDYFVQKVLAYFPETKTKKAHCKAKTMGLIALHIAHKTHWAPQWIWSTFSFKDNVPNDGDPHAQATPFFNPARLPTEQDACWKQPFLISPENCPNVELNRFTTPLGTKAPNQITRLQAIQGSGLNKVFSKQLAGTPFKNYVLLDTQWPFNGRSSGGEINAFNCKENNLGSNCYTMIPRYLRNPVVESYMSTYNYQRQQYSNRSCMSCHTEAGADASYIWLDGVEQVVPIK